MGTDKLGKVWGLGSETSGDPGPWEGELRNMWKPTQQDGLWIHGGNLLQNRFYSLYLALQLKARYEGFQRIFLDQQRVGHVMRLPLTLELTSRLFVSSEPTAFSICRPSIFRCLKVQFISSNFLGAPLNSLSLKVS